MSERVCGSEAQNAFYEQVFMKYLYSGSVDEVAKDTSGVSFADLHRKLKMAGIVKSPAGPRASLPELILFFRNYVDHVRDPRETPNVATFYKRFTSGMSVPLETVWRVHNTITNGFNENQLGRTKRHAVGLLLSPVSEPTRVLVGNDIGVERLGYGKRFDDISLPMGFSAKPQNESPRTSILRVLQREVWPNFAVKGKFGIDSRLAESVIPEEPEFLGELEIVDTGVRIYRMDLPDELCNPENFYPLKLRNHRFVEVNDLNEGVGGLRTGVSEISNMYRNRLQAGGDYVPELRVAQLNHQLQQIYRSRMTAGQSMVYQAS